MTRKWTGDVFCLFNNIGLYYKNVDLSHNPPCVKQGGSAIEIYGNSKFEKVARFFEIRNIISQKLSLVEQKGAQFVITDLWFPI